MEIKSLADIRDGNRHWQEKQKTDGRRRQMKDFGRLLDLQNHDIADVHIAIYLPCSNSLHSTGKDDPFQEALKSPEV